MDNLELNLNIKFKPFQYHKDKTIENRDLISINKEIINKLERDLYEFPLAIIRTMPNCECMATVDCINSKLSLNNDLISELEIFI